MSNKYSNVRFAEDLHSRYLWYSGWWICGLVLSSYR